MKQDSFQVEQVVMPNNRVYEPRCASIDVALRAVCQVIEDNNKWEWLEEYDLDKELVQSQLKPLSRYYGSFRDGIWRDKEMMRLIREACPSIVPVAESFLVMYLVVTLGTKNKHRSRSAA